MIKPRAMALLFGLYGCLAVLLMATIMPPYQNADEGAHFTRADQVSHGGLIARHDPAADPRIDSGVMEGAVRFGAVAGPPRRLVTRPLYAPLPWGPRRADGYVNTEIYPPFFYLPAAFGTWVARRLHYTVLPGLELARGASGFASVAAGALAIAWAGPAAIWLFAVMTLPMALAQMAAVTQDGPMIAASALLTAALLRLDGSSTRRPLAWLALAGVALALIGMARPPYAALAALPLLVRGVPRRGRAACAGLALAAMAAWWWISVTRSNVDIVHFNRTDATAQAANLLWAPWRFARALARTLELYGGGFIEGFIGKLAWLDIAMPQSYRRIAYGMLAMAACSAALAGRRWASWKIIIAGCAALLAACAGLFVIQYLTWTQVGAPTIEGVQGRYFIPPALVAGAIFCRRDAIPSRLATILTWPILLFPVATIVVMLHRVLLRYYL